MFISDWHVMWNKERIEKELRGFVFKGPGWYFTKTDTVLITPALGDVRFYVYVWGTPSRGTMETGNPVELIKWIANAPVHQDER